MQVVRTSDYPPFSVENKRSRISVRAGSGYFFSYARQRAPEFLPLDADLKPRTEIKSPEKIASHLRACDAMACGQVEKLLPHHGKKRDLLDHPGKVTAEIAKAFAESEFGKFRITRDRLFPNSESRAKRPPYNRHVMLPLTRTT